MKVGETGTEEEEVEEEESGYSEGWMDLKEGGWLGVSCFMYFTGPHPAFLPPCRSCRSRGRRIPRRLIPQRVAANGAGGSAVLLERRQRWVGRYVGGGDGVAWEMGHPLNGVLGGMYHLRLHFRVVKLIFFHD